MESMKVQDLVRVKEMEMEKNVHMLKEKVVAKIDHAEVFGMEKENHL